MITKYYIKLKLPQSYVPFVLLQQRELSLVNPRVCYCEYLPTGYPPVALAPLTSVLHMFMLSTYSVHYDSVEECLSSPPVT